MEELQCAKEIFCTQCDEDKQADLLCIDIKCDEKQFLCGGCKDKFHKDHKNIKIDDYFKAIKNIGNQINDFQPRLLQSQYETSQLFEFSKQQFKDIKEKLENQEKSMLNLFQFNKDITTKLINKDISTLESIQAVQNELNVETKNEKAKKKIRQKHIIKEQLKFINRLAVEHYENPNATSSDVLFQKLIDEIKTKDQIIHSFNKVVRDTFKKFTDQIHNSITDLQQAQIDIVNLVNVQIAGYLDGKLQQLRHPDQYILKIHKKDEQLGFFSTLTIEQDIMKDLGVLQNHVSSFYNIDKESITFKRNEDNQQVDFNVNLPEYLKSNNIFCQIDNEKIHNEQYKNITKNLKNPIIIGVSGATRSGKGVLSNHLRITLDAHIISQDMFFDVEKIYKELGGNWETPEAIKWDQIQQTFEKQLQIAKENNKKVILVEGFLLYSQPQIIDMFNIKFFLKIEKHNMYIRRMRTKPVPEDYFQSCIVEGYKKYEEQINQIKDQKKIHILDSKLRSQQIFQQAMQIVQEYCDANSEQ